MAARRPTVIVRHRPALKRDRPVFASGVTRASVNATQYYRAKITSHRADMLGIVMKLVAAVLLCICPAIAARADEAAQCQANAGSYLTGKVISGPRFVSGRPRGGVELSHTHLRLLSDQDGQSYDIAIDNVFAGGYDAAGERVPAPLSSIHVGDRLALCGQLYIQGGQGIHFVHTNCGDKPNANDPDGWVKLIAADGSSGPNLEDSREYCRLWP
jgi:hypothetical protein